jgi:hypothetical protein
MKKDFQSTKMRIITFDDGGVKSDRLVEQVTELRIGPKEVHKGPYSLEFNLRSQEEVDQMVEYIKKLKGDLPITTAEKKTTQTKKLDKMLSEKEPLMDLLKTVKAKAKTQEDLIKMLRESNFMFVNHDLVEDMGGTKKQISLKERHISENWQFMVRRIKEAKVPENDKYDFRLVFGIKIMGERFDKVQVYLWGKWTEVIKLKWADKKKVNFKKVEILASFPEWMDYAERKKWRQENRRIEKDPTIQPSKFYLKCKPYVKTY